jgi:hypothetical protein
MPVYSPPPPPQMDQIYCMYISYLLRQAASLLNTVCPSKTELPVPLIML